MGLKILIISLRESNRRNFQDIQFKQLGLEFSYLEAINTENYQKYITNENFDHWERTIKPTERACYLSHKKAWMWVIENNQPALILEDDALISRYILELIPTIKKLNSIDYINLENRGRKKIVSNQFFSVSKNIELRKLFHDTTGAAGYILFPSGAKKLISCEARKGVAIADAQISNCRKLASYQTCPALIIQLDMCNYYNFPNSQNFTNISLSTVSSESKQKKSFKNKVNRIKSQANIGIRRIVFRMFGKERFIKIANKKTFHL